MRVTSSTDLSNLTDLDGVKRYGTQALSEMKEALNGNISTDNLRCFVTQIAFTAANMEARVNHRLNKIPVGYWKILGPDVRLFDGSTAATKEEIYIQSSGAGTVTVLVLG